MQLLSPYYYSTSEKRSFEHTSFLDRMRESEVKKRLKLDSLRMEKRFEEYQQCPKQPVITPSTYRILAHSPLHAYYQPNPLHLSLGEAKTL